MNEWMNKLDLEMNDCHRWINQQISKYINEVMDK